MKKFCLLIFCLVVSCSISFAQGGSNYSIFGLGDIQQSIGGFYQGLGGTSIAFPSQHGINTRNPAMWSFVKTTRLQAGYRFNQNIVNSENATLWQNNGNINGILGIFAIDTSRGISASFGIIPYSSVNYLITNPFKVSVDSISLTGSTLYQGSGGMSIAYVGFAFRPIEQISVGASVFANFGYLNTAITTVVNDDNYFNILNSQYDNFSGYGFRLGAVYTGIENLMLGFTTELMPGFGIERKLTYSSDLITDTSFTSDYDINFPNTFGFGLSYTTGKFILGADYTFQDFSNFGYKGGPNTKFKNQSTVSVAVSRVGNKQFSGPFLDKIQYNFGLTYKDLYYSVFNSNMKEYSGSIGFSIPLVGAAFLDAGFSFGQRTGNNAKLPSEYFGRMSLDISIGEYWFKPFRDK